MKKIRDRWVIVGRSPTSGRLMYLTTQKTLATRGHSMKFASIEKAFEQARKLIAAHPEIRAYNLFADKLRPPTLKNPSGYTRARDSYTREMDRAADTFESFTGRPATHKTAMKIPTPKAGFALGPLVGVIYRANRVDDGGTFEYLHRFRKSSQPLLIASDDGNSLVISGGEFQVTERGIEDK